jgi:hypothetical protein
LSNVAWCNAILDGENITETTLEKEFFYLSCFPFFRVLWSPVGKIRC